MKLGIFDSGLGGLVITKAVREVLPNIDILYYGDTLHLPYGNRSDSAIIEYTRRAMVKMFDQGCSLIIMACNTASAAALRYLQQNWLQDHYPDRNIIGVVVPTLETAIERGYKKLGLIGTNYIINAGIYREELQKLDPAITLVQTATPLLVPIIEHDGGAWARDIVAHYLTTMVDQGIECLILGCTHYPTLYHVIKDVIGNDIDILSQDHIIPQKLKAYIARHPEYDVGHNSHEEFYVSDLTDNYLKAAHYLYGEDIEVKILYCF